MSKCVVCEKETYLRLLSCCQLDSEAKHKICKPCTNRLDKCPLCRAEKRLTPKEFNKVIDQWEMDFWMLVNIVFAYYRYKMLQFETDRITPLEYACFLTAEFPYSNIDDLPGGTQINLIDYVISSDDDST